VGRARQLQQLAAAKGLSMQFQSRGRDSVELCSLIMSFVQSPCNPVVDGWTHAAHLNIRMRAILIDWLFDVAMRKQLEDPVMHYTVALIDAYVAQHPDLHRSRLQLLGVTALLVADKIVGIETVTPAEMAYFTANTYTTEEVKDFEIGLVDIVAGTFAGWGAHHFLVHAAAEVDLPVPCFHVAQLFLEAGLLSFAFQRHTPGLRAAAACSIAMNSLKQHLACSDQHLLPSWSRLSVHCGHSGESICRVARELDQHYEHLRHTSLRALVDRKFMHHRYSQAAGLVSDAVRNEGASAAAAAAA